MKPKNTATIWTNYDGYADELNKQIASGRKFENDEIQYRYMERAGMLMEAGHSKGAADRIAQTQVDFELEQQRRFR